MASDSPLSASMIEKLRARGFDVDALLKATAAIQSPSGTERDPTPLEVDGGAAGNNAAHIVLTDEADSASSLPSHRSKVTPPRNTRSKKRTRVEGSASTRRSSRLNRRREETGAAEGANASEEEPEKDLPNRLVIPVLTVDPDYLKDHALGEVLEIFEHQGWGKLLFESPKVNESLLREFYNSYSLQEGKDVRFGTFSIGGEAYAFTSQYLAKWLNVPHAGYADYSKGRWPSSVTPREIVDWVAENPEAPIGNGNNSSMGILHRTLHRFLCSNFLPRLQKHSIILIQDYLILNRLLKREAISLPHQIMLHMDHIRTAGSHGLPYPGVVKLILENCHAYVAEEEVNFWEPLVKSNFSKMGWEYNTASGWGRTGARPKPTPTPRRTEHGAPPNVPLVDITPLLEGLKRLEDLVTSVAARVTAVERSVDLIGDRVTKVEESVNIILANQIKYSESITELNSQLRYVGTRLLERLEDIFRGR